MLLWLVAALVLLTPAMSAGQPSGPGAELYIAKGCLGCHGASGRGGVGPPLADTTLTVEAFVGQLRSPRGIMPPFHARVVSDAEAQAIHAYLKTVPPPPPKLRADVPHGVLDQATCAECHRRLHPTIVTQFEAGAMGKAGVQNPRVTVPGVHQMTCAACHGTNHDDIMASIAHSTSSVDDSNDCIGPVASPMPRTSKRNAGTPPAASARARSTN